MRAVTVVLKESQYGKLVNGERIQIHEKMISAVEDLPDVLISDYFEVPRNGVGVWLCEKDIKLLHPEVDSCFMRNAIKEAEPQKKTARTKLFGPQICYLLMPIDGDLSKFREKGVI